MNHKQGLERNIWIYYLFQFVDFLSFFGAISAFYYLDIGLNIFQITLFSIAVGISKLIFEIPSGIISDKYGRKTSLIIYAISFFLTGLILIITKNYYFLMLSSFVLGIKISFRSGSDNSLLYDSLKELKRDKEFSKILSKGGTVHFIGMTVGFLLGPIVAKMISMSAMLLLNIIPSIIMLFAVGFIIEPNFTKSSKSPKKHLSDTFKKAFQNKKILYLIITFALMRTIIIGSFEFIQIFFKEFSLDLIWFGVIYSAWTIIAAIAASQYSKIKDKTSDTFFMDIILIIITIGLFIIGFSTNLIFVLIGYTIIEIIFGIYFPLHNHFIHRELKSNERATVYSIMSQITSIFYMLMIPFMGFIAKTYNSNLTLIILGFLSLFGIGISYIQLRRHLN